ncbi:MAG: hypothetical protein V1746_02645, partial [bacterium]
MSALAHIIGLHTERPIAMEVEEAIKILVESCLPSLKSREKLTGHVPPRLLESVLFLELGELPPLKTLQEKRGSFLLQDSQGLNNKEKRANAKIILFDSQTQQGFNAKEAWAKVYELIRKELGKRFMLSKETPREIFPDAIEEKTPLYSPSEGADDPDEPTPITENLMESYASFPSEDLSAEQKAEEGAASQQATEEGNDSIFGTATERMEQLASDLANLGGQGERDDDTAVIQNNISPSPVSIKPQVPKRNNKTKATDLLPLDVILVIEEIKEAANDELNVKSKDSLKNCL